jgi:outer membrane protein assembly factor BamB
MPASRRNERNAAAAELARVWRRPPESAARYSLSYSVDLEAGTFNGDGDWQPSHSFGTAALDSATGAINWRYRPRGQPRARRRWPFRATLACPSYR